MLTTASLRADLLNDLAQLRDGKITVSQARARAAIARSVCDTLKIELAAASLAKQKFEPVLLLDAPRPLGIAA